MKTECATFYSAMALAVGMNEMKLEIVKENNHMKVEIEKARQEEEKEIKDPLFAVYLRIGFSYLSK